MLKLTANLETLIPRASEQAEFSRTLEIGHFITNESVIDGNSSTLFCREYSEPRNVLKFEITSILNDHVKIGPVTEIEVFESAGTLVKEVQAPSRQPGNSKSWIRISQGIEKYARQFLHEITEHQNTGAVLSP